MQDTERRYSVYSTLSHAAESFYLFREPLLGRRIIQILFKLYFEDLNENKIYIVHVSLVTKLGSISFTLFSLTYSYHCYSIRLSFWLLSWLSPFAIHSPDGHRCIWQWPERRSISVLELEGSAQANKAEKWKWQCLFVPHSKHSFMPRKNGRRETCSNTSKWTAVIA